MVKLLNAVYSGNRTMQDTLNGENAVFMNFQAERAYVVWQKNNETDFLLTMNFILFTNQGYLSPSK